MNTDDKDSRTVFLQLLACSRAWEGEVRIIGNIRAMDIARVVEEHIINDMEFYATLSPDENGKYGVWFSRGDLKHKINEWDDYDRAEHEAEMLTYIAGKGPLPEPQ